MFNDSRAQDPRLDRYSRASGSRVSGRVSSNFITTDGRGPGGGSADAGPSERSTSEKRPRLHSFGGAGAFHRAPSELRAAGPVDARPFGG